jgi:hypothetical protein
LKNLFLILLISLFTLGISAQSEQSGIPAAFGIEEIYLAKDEAGKAGAVTESFSTVDVPIHCVVRLDSMKTVTVKMNFVAEKVPGVKPETKVISISYKTDGAQNQVNFIGKPDGQWIAGTYRIDIYIDEAAAASKRFEIKKTPQKSEKTPLQNVKNFVPVKPKPARRPRKY